MNELCEGVEADEDGDADRLLPLSVEEGGHEDKCGCHGAFGEAEEETNGGEACEVLGGGEAEADCASDDAVGWGRWSVDYPCGGVVFEKL